MADLDLTGPVPGISQLATAGDWESFFLPGMADGVASGLVPSLNSGARQVSLSAGIAFVRAYVAKAAAANVTSVPAASGSDRIDRLVLRLDRTASTEATWIVPTILTGTPGSSPQPPAVTQSADHLWDLKICRWTSKSNGSLSGLIDERQVLGGPVLSMPGGSAGAPAPAARRIAIMGSQVVASLDGATWDTVLYSDSGWQSLSLNGPNAGAWSLDGSCRVRVLNGVAHLRFSVMREGNVALGVLDSNGSTPFVLPSWARPSVSEPGWGYSGFFNGPRGPAGCLVDTDGKVTLYALGFSGATSDVQPSGVNGTLGNIAAGTVIGGGATYLIG